MDEKLNYNSLISFEGSPEEFEGILEELMKLVKKGLMIDTVPVLEHPAKGLMIDTVPLPEKFLGVAIGTVPLPEDIKKQLAIGTWPTPERLALQVYRWPRPLPWPGDIPAVRILGPKILEKLSDGMYKLKTDIDGGIRDAHFHMDDGIVLLNRERFREYMGHVVQALGQELLR